MNKTTILTGIRANNDLTIGNYFGAIAPTVAMAKQRSEEYQINLFIPDLHSFTTPIDYQGLYKQIMHTAQVFAAAGLPLQSESIHMYRQSRIPAHSELTWILSCFTGVGEMSRMTQFKDKSTNVGDTQTSVGLFSYPVLMASDILLYNATYVPVGDDQTQHLEFTRDIAGRINNRFGELFVVPKSVKQQHEFFMSDEGLRLKDLVDPSKKMSKSDDSGRGVIFLSDSPKQAAKKIMSATTDNEGVVRYNPETQPGISNLIEIMSLASGRSHDEVVREVEGMERYGDFKKLVANSVMQFIEGFQQKLAAVDASEVQSCLERSEQAMNVQAKQTLHRVQRAVGLRKPGE